MLLPPRVDQQLTLQAVNSGAQSVLELTAQDEQGRPINDLAIEGRLVDPANAGAPLAFTQVGAGRYRALASTEMPGVYLAQVAASAGGQPLGVATAGLAVSYSPEYSERRDDPQLLRDLATLTGGRLDPIAAAAFVPTGQLVGRVSVIGLPLLWLALLLWPLDVGVRRLHLRLAEFVPLLARRRTADAAGQAATLARLSAAKQRAVVRTENREPRTVDDRRTTTDERPFAVAVPEPVALRQAQEPGQGRRPTNNEQRTAKNQEPRTDNQNLEPRTTDNGQRTTDDSPVLIHRLKL
jgi:hypothetical protein